MPDANSHFRQADRNLQVVSVLNTNPSSYWDWQVTALFYSALHLVNGHIMKTDGGFYNTHASVQIIIHPGNTESKARLPRDIVLAYEKLQFLSRKAQYLYDASNGNSHNPQYVGAGGFERAVHAYEVVYAHLAALHHLKIDPIYINCLKAGWQNRSLPLGK
jgi:hypothetical protein